MGVMNIAKTLSPFNSKDTYSMIREKERMIGQMFWNFIIWSKQFMLQGITRTVYSCTHTHAE